jgi:hypothetical protein
MPVHPSQELGPSKAAMQVLDAITMLVVCDLVFAAAVWVDILPDVLKISAPVMGLYLYLGSVIWTVSMLTCVYIVLSGTISPPMILLCLALPASVIWWCILGLATSPVELGALYAVTITVVLVAAYRALEKPRAHRRFCLGFAFGACSSLALVWTAPMPHHRRGLLMLTWQSWLEMDWSALAAVTNYWQLALGIVWLLAYFSGWAAMRLSGTIHMSGTGGAGSAGDRLAELPECLPPPAPSDPYVPD